MSDKPQTTPEPNELTYAQYAAVLRRMVKHRDGLSRAITTLKEGMDSYFPNEEGVCIVEVKGDVYDMLTGADQ